VVVVWDSRGLVNDAATVHHGGMSGLGGTHSAAHHTSFNVAQLSKPPKLMPVIC